MNVGKATTQPLEKQDAQPIDLQRNAPFVATFIIITLLTGCAGSKYPSASSHSSAPNASSVDRKTPARRTSDIDWASPSGLGKTKEAQVHRELATAVEHWRQAYERREVAVLEKLLADDFTVSFSGQTQTRSNALAGLRLSQAELTAIEDLKIRVDEHFPVVTFRSTMRFKAGTETFMSETLSSLQFRLCSGAEEQRGCERWVVTSAAHMPVHQMPPGYWARENSWIPKP